MPLKLHRGCSTADSVKL